MKLSRDLQPSPAPTMVRLTPTAVRTTTAAEASATTPQDGLELSGASPLKAPADKNAPAPSTAEPPAPRVASAQTQLASSQARAPLAQLEETIPGVQAEEPKTTITPQEMVVYHARNAEMTKEYPALAQILKDPDAFMSDMRSRFDAQKAKTPDDPYSFDFSDYGVPVLKDLSEKIGKESASEQQKLGQMQGPHVLPDLLGRRANQAKDLKTGLQFTGDLKKEIDGLIAGGKVSYKRLQELSYFSARAMGAFHHDDLSVKDKTLLNVDRWMQGYQKEPVQEEYRRYKDNDYSVFQHDSPVGQFQDVQKTFADGFANKDKLEMVCLPTSQALGTDIFMRLLSYPIYPVGLTDQPIAADGFNRPGGDFFLHDLRHSSDMFGRAKAYQEQNHLSDDQMSKVRKMSDVWATQCDEAVKKLPDKDLQGAINMFMFNYHHDRGYPVVPSSYIGNESNEVPDLLYGMSKLSHQSVEFNGIIKIPEAHRWLQNFWLSRLPQEQAVTGASTVPAGNADPKKPRLAL